MASITINSAAGVNLADKTVHSGIYSASTQTTTTTTIKYTDGWQMVASGTFVPIADGSVSLSGIVRAFQLYDASQTLLFSGTSIGMGVDDFVARAGLVTSVSGFETLLYGLITNDNSIDGSHATITGGSGNDTIHMPIDQALTIDGGAGVDTLKFDVGRATYKLTQTANGYAYDSLFGGMTTFSNIERLQFYDQRVALDTGISGNAGQAYRLYQAALNRTPDAAGEGFYIRSLDGGQGLREIAANFMASPEFQAKYGTPTNGQLVDLFYQNVLHRAADASGHDYWTNILDTNQQTRAEVLIGFSNSPELQASLVGVIGSGIEYI